jgi:hypothetical protein
LSNPQDAAVVRGVHRCADLAAQRPVLQMNPQPSSNNNARGWAPTARAV